MNLIKNALGIETELKPVVGTVVTLSMDTEDEDLNEFLEEHGNKVLITSRENDMYWGDIVIDEVTMERIDLPYHFEYRDILSVDYINTYMTNEERYYTKKYIQELLQVNDLSASEITDNLLDSQSDKQLAVMAYVLATVEFEKGE
jgi:hypothetical protein